MRWNEGYVESIPLLNSELIVSHRDPHYGNVIWDGNGKAHLIDWESAGVINPYMEVIGYSLEWSGILLGHPKMAIFNGIIGEYVEITHRKCNYPVQAFYGWLGHCVLAWLFFNLYRASGLISNDLSEIERGKAALHGGLIDCLRYLAVYEEDLWARIKSNLFA